MAQHNRRRLPRQRGSCNHVTTGISKLLLLAISSVVMLGFPGKSHASTHVAPADSNFHWSSQYREHIEKDNSEVDISSLARRISQQSLNDWRDDLVDRRLKSSKKSTSKGDASLGIAGTGKGGKGDTKSAKKASTKSSKKASVSKKASTKSKGKGDNIFDNGKGGYSGSDDSDDSPDYSEDDDKVPAPPMAPPTVAPISGSTPSTSPISFPSTSPVSWPSASPVSLPSASPVSLPSASPVSFPSGGSPSLPSPAPTIGGATPTIGTPTTVGTPSEAPFTPTVPSLAPFPPSGRDPTTSAPGGPAPSSAPVSRCTIGSDGLFGSQVGLSEEVTFVYQTEVTPSVTVAALNLQILADVEAAIGGRVLERIFDQCAVSTTSLQRVTLELLNGEITNSGTVTHKNVLDGGRYRHLRTLQSTAGLTGMSTRPRDTVIENVDCVNVEQTFPCYVIQGRLTTYSEQPISDEILREVSAAVQAAIEAGGLEDPADGVLSVTWRDLTTDPIPGTEDDDTGNAGDDTTPTPAPANLPTTPVIRDVSGNDELEVWAISLIAVGGVLFCCTGYLCLRQPTHSPVLDEDDDDDDGPSESSDDFEDENRKEKTRLVAAPVPVSAPSPAAQNVQSRQAPSRQKDQPRRDPYMVASPPQPPPIHEAREERSQSSRKSRSSRSSSRSSDGSPIERQSVGTRSMDSKKELKSGNAGKPKAALAGPVKYQDSGHSLELNTFNADPSALTMNADSQPSPLNGSKRSGSDSGSKWDEKMFVENAEPPMESTSEEFSSEYSEEEMVEEYEIEYVEEDEGLEGVDEEESFSDEYEDEEEDGGVVQDEPGKTPILPWLAKDDQ